LGFYFYFLKSSSTPPVTSSVTNDHKESTPSKAISKLVDALGFPHHKTTDAKILKAYTLSWVSSGNFFFLQCCSPNVAISSH